MQSDEFITTVQDIAQKYGIGEDGIGLMQEVVTIGKECKPYLSQVTDPLSMYRGLNGVYQSIIIKKKIRLDFRQTSAMPSEVTKNVNNYFTKVFGEPFRFAMFASGDIRTSDDFGDTFVVFPIGKFTFVWSPKVYDLNSAFWNFEDSEVYSEDGINRILAHSEYTNLDINAAIASGNEIMIRADGYYGFRYKDLEYDRDLPTEAVLELLQMGMKQ